ncbi:DNA-binding protein WhiA [Velocimicrobium porci]|uniref:Probable cell division protein WhiA n=1 Tax=Velocimicrobium porci TaxID=2606634 RepID=A0A6L5XWF9_9FIRM|nr:DNA-binding protein WhiA [Velocimicrobium porci]MSS62761.1 DNA-binding protein WhiA [Velocimicrobium porci]
MSFSKKVKEELSKQISTARHCQIAEIAAIISLCGNIIINERNEYFIKIHTENLTVARKYFILIKKSFQVSAEISIRKNVNLKKSKIYTVLIKDSEAALLILKATKLIDINGEIREELSITTNLVVQSSCCKRAFIRGAFLAYGSMSDPAKTYHFEIVTSTKAKASQLQEIIHFFGIDAKIVLRKKYYVVYVKEGSQIVDLLNIMEAHVALMELENVRILKEMRNSINRQVNCETANINKTVTAATKQIEDIQYIKDTIGFGELSEGLEEIAKIRLEQPEASLKELGTLLNPPIGKSGVNHRLRKLSEIADRLREEKER